MGVFIPNPEYPSVEEILADPAWLRLLFALTAKHLFLTAGQAQHLRRQTASPDTPQLLLSSKHTRFVLDRLTKAEFLGAASALLPPVTIRDTPVFIHRYLFGDPNTFTQDEAKRICETANARLPPISQHAQRKLYFARQSLCPVLREAGYTVAPWRTAWDGRAREETVQNILGWHNAVEIRSECSPSEIACTPVTAQYNLNELRFFDRYCATDALGGCKFSANGRPTQHHADGSLDEPSVNLVRLNSQNVIGLESLVERDETDITAKKYDDVAADRIGLFFLRPLLPHQLIEQVILFRTELSRFFHDCWWM
jgi:hypothetical protein